MTNLYTFITRFVIFATTHSILATHHVQQAVEHVIGSYSRYYRIWYNLLSLALFGWTFAAYPNPRVLYVVPGAWSLACYLLQLLLLVLLVRCSGQTGFGNFLGLDQIKGIAIRSELIKSGCYSRVRHPQYSLTIIFLLLNPVMSDKWLALSILSTLYFIIGAVIEEKRLHIIFGDEYRQYRTTVPMFIPKFRLLIG